MKDSENALHIIEEMASFLAEQGHPFGPELLDQERRLRKILSVKDTLLEQDAVLNDQMAVHAAGNLQIDKIPMHQNLARLHREVAGL